MGKFGGYSSLHCSLPMKQHIFISSYKYLQASGHISENVNTIEIPKEKNNRKSNCVKHIKIYKIAII